MSLKGKSIVITGGNGGIGFGIARHFLKLGAQVSVEKPRRDPTFLWSFISFTTFPFDRKSRYLTLNFMRE